MAHTTETATDQDDAVGSAPPRPLGRLARWRAARHSRTWIFATMLVSATASLVAAFVLSVDAWRLAANPDLQLACDISSVLSCATVAQSWQATLFGFPNAFIGLVCEPVVITLAVAALGGVRFPRWFMVAAQTVYLLGLVLAYWLFAQSLLVIGAMCPWCLLITVSTTFVFVSLLHANALEGNLYLPAGAQRSLRRFFETDNDVIVLAAVMVGLTALVLAKYGPVLLG